MAGINECVPVLLWLMCLPEDGRRPRGVSTLCPLGQSLAAALDCTVSWCHVKACKGVQPGVHAADAGKHAATACSSPDPWHPPFATKQAQHMVMDMLALGVSASAMYLAKNMKVSHQQAFVICCAVAQGPCNF